VALAHPDLAAEQLETAVKKLGMRGALVGGSVNGTELADPKLHPFWAKAEQLGVLVFIHPQGTPELEASGRLKGNGGLYNVIGNPLETTIALSHLIFEGTLDKFPGLKICGGHAGGYLPSYAARSDRMCENRPDLCKVSLQKKPSELNAPQHFENASQSPAIHLLTSSAGFTPMRTSRTFATYQPGLVRLFSASMTAIGSRGSGALCGGVSLPSGTMVSRSTNGPTNGVTGGCCVSGSLFSNWRATVSSVSR